MRLANLLQNRKVMLSFLSSFALVFFIPFLLSILLYQFSIRDATRNAVEMNNMILDSASELMETQLRNIENISYEILENPQVRSFQYKTKSFTYPESYRMIEVRNSLGNYALTQSFVSNYFLFFNSSEIVMNHQIIYTYDDFFKQYLSVTGSATQTLAEDIRSLNLGVGLHPVVRLTVAKEENNYLPYLSMLTSQGNGYLCILIEERELMSLFSAISLGDSGCLYLTGRSGQKLASLSGESCDFDTTSCAVEQYRLEHPGEDHFTLHTAQGYMLVNRVISDVFGISCVSVQPMSVVTERVQSLQKAMLISSLLFFIAGIFVCVVQAKRYSTPMVSLMDAVGLNKGDSKEALDFIEKMVKNLMNDNDRLQRLTAEHKSVLKVSLANRLLNGSFSSETEALRLFDYACPGIVPVEESICLLMHIQSPMESTEDDVALKLLGSMKVALKDICERFWPESLSCDLDEETLALIVFNRSRDDIDRTYRMLFHACPSSLQEVLTACGGKNGGASLTGISQSFESVRITMMNHHLSQNELRGEIIWEESPASNMQYFYPPDTRYRLTESITHGNEEEVTNIVNDLFRVNLAEASIQPTIFRLFVSELLVTALRCFPMLPLTSFEDELQERILQVTEAPIQKQKDLILDFFLFLTSQAEKSLPEEENTMRQVIQYIHDHYHESDISLAGIADHFSMNPSVLSTNFKMYTNKTMSTYLEDLRIQEAQHLLRTTDWTVNRIAEEVGYLSSNSFCRAFRRNTGYNASTYRSQNEG